MSRRTVIFLILIFILTLNSPHWAQNANPAAAGITATGAIGTITTIDLPNNVLSLQTESGEVIGVLVNDQTAYLRVPPGEKDLRSAAKITLADIGVGDKVFARGKVAEDRKTMSGRQVIVMSSADIKAKQERERMEWRRRGIAGTIAALNPETKEITLQTRTREGQRPITVALKEKVLFRRYAPDSIKFADAGPSSFAELKVGDQLRALGDRNEDNTRFTAEEVVSGAFRTINGTVTALNPETGEITLTELQTQKTIKVKVKPDSMLRRLPPEFATMLAQRSAGGAPGGAAPQGGAPGQATRPTEGGPRSAGPAQGGQAGGPMGNRPMGGVADLSEMVERMPALTLAELKPGNFLVVSSTQSAEAGQATAITVIGGLDALLTAFRAAAARPGGGQSGPGFGGLDFGFGMGTP